MAALIRRLYSIQLVRFGTVGVLVTGCFMGLNALFARGFGWRAQLAFLAAYPPALCIHFLLNKLWTFGDRRTTSGRHIGEYLFTAVLTFLIQWPAFTLLHDFAHAPGWLAAGGANVLQVTASFLLLRRRVFDAGGQADEGGGRNAWHRLTLLLATVSTAALLVWTALGGWDWPEIGPSQSDYYNLLASGFRKGTLALDVPVPEALLRAKNPWDPAQRPAGVAMHDASYYRGHFYIYFGVVPVALLYFPFLLLTGHALPYSIGFILFSLGAYLLAAWLWTRVLRDFFPGASLVTKLVGVVALGTVGGQLVLARRVSLWEGPIAAGHWFMMVFLAAGYLSGRSRRGGVWLATAGLALGLAVGSRPSLFAATPALIWLMIVRGTRSGGPTVRTRLTSIIRAAMAAGLPFAAVVGLVLAYNYARFGQLFEFGMKYQLTGEDASKVHAFSLSYVGYNLETYFFRAPQWGRYFPFLHPVEYLAPPAGYYGIEYVYGAVWVCPLVVWALLALGYAGRRVAHGLASFVGFVAITALGTTAFLLATYAATARYTVDFLPWWPWLACLGWAGLEQWLKERRRVNLAGSLRMAFAFTAAFSCLVAFCASVELHDLLEIGNPKAYAAISRIFDAPVALWEQWRGERNGPLEMTVTFSNRVGAAIEPLLVLGVSYQTDYLYVNYISTRLVRIGYAPSGLSGILSDPIEIEPDRAYHLRVETGSLYPPVGHPAYDGWNEVEVKSVKRWVRVDLGGRPVLNDTCTSHEASPDALRIGVDKPRGTYGERFSGTITAVVREGVRQPRTNSSDRGDIQLDLTLPRTPVEGNQPLLELGRPGLADVVGLQMVDTRRVRFTYESWSLGLWASPPFTVGDDRDLSVRVRVGPLLGIEAQSPLRLLRESVVVWLDGRPVWWRKTGRPIAPTPPVYLGDNALGSSAMIDSVRGRLAAWSRGPAPAAWPTGRLSGLAMAIGGRGSGIEPLLSIGSPDHGLVVAIAWLPGDRAQVIGHGSGTPLPRGPEFVWSGDRPHQVRIRLPSPDAPRAKPKPQVGAVAVWVDGASVWQASLPPGSVASDSLVVGMNPGGWTDCAAELSAVLIDAVPSTAAGSQ